MYHGVPMAGDFSSRFLGYHPKLFARMQEANVYEMRARWIWAAGERKPSGVNWPLAAGSGRRRPGALLDGREVEGAL
jgi:hypothetical protein